MSALDSVTSTDWACAEIFFPHPHKSNRSIRAPFSFARPLSWEHCPPPLISIPYALRQHNLNSTSVQNSVIIFLFKKFCVIFFIVTLLFLLKVYVCLYSSVCWFVLSSFIIVPTYLSVFSVLRLSFRPFRQGFAKYSRSRTVVFFIYLCFF